MHNMNRSRSAPRRPSSAQPSHNSSAKAAPLPSSMKHKQSQQQKNVSNSFPSPSSDAENQKPLFSGASSGSIPASPSSHQSRKLLRRGSVEGSLRQNHDGLGKEPSLSLITSSSKVSGFPLQEISSPFYPQQQSQLQNQNNVYRAAALSPSYPFVPSNWSQQQEPSSSSQPPVYSSPYSGQSAFFPPKQSSAPPQLQAAYPQSQYSATWAYPSMQPIQNAHYYQPSTPSTPLSQLDSIKASYYLDASSSSQQQQPLPDSWAWKRESLLPLQSSSPSPVVVAGTTSPSLDAHASAIRFPNVRSILWDRTEIGAPIHLRALDIVPRIDLPMKTLRTLFSFLIQNPPPLSSSASPSEWTDADPRCYLIGRISTASASPSSSHSDSLSLPRKRLSIRVDRFDGGKRDLAPPSSSSSSSPAAFTVRPTVVMDGDIPVEVFARNRNDFPSSELSASDSLRFSSSLYARFFAEFEQKCSRRARPFKVSDLMYAALRLICVTDPYKDTLHMATEALFPAIQFRLAPVPSPRVIQTALADALSSAQQQQQQQQQQQHQHAVASEILQSGFLTMDQNRRVLLLSESDPKAFALPLVGVWISGVSAPEDPAVWCACARYIHSTAFMEKVMMPSQSFLVMLYINGLDRYQSYDCTFEQSESVRFAQYRASHSVSMVPTSPPPSAGSSSPPPPTLLRLELRPASDPSSVRSLVTGHIASEKASPVHRGPSKTALASQVTPSEDEGGGGPKPRSSVPAPHMPIDSFLSSSARSVSSAFSAPAAKQQQQQQKRIPSFAQALGLSVDDSSSLSAAAPPQAQTVTVDLNLLMQQQGLLKDLVNQVRSLQEQLDSIRNNNNSAAVAAPAAPAPSNPLPPFYDVVSDVLRSGQSVPLLSISQSQTQPQQKSRKEVFISNSGQSTPSKKKSSRKQKDEQPEEIFFTSDDSIHLDEKGEEELKTARRLSSRIDPHSPSAKKEVSARTFLTEIVAPSSSLSASLSAAAPQQQQQPAPAVPAAAAAAPSSSVRSSRYQTPAYLADYESAEDKRVGQVSDADGDRVVYDADENVQLSDIDWDEDDDFEEGDNSVPSGGPATISPPQGAAERKAARSRLLTLSGTYPFGAQDMGLASCSSAVLLARGSNSNVKDSIGLEGLSVSSSMVSRSSVASSVSSNSADLNFHSAATSIRRGSSLAATADAIRCLTSTQLLHLEIPRIQYDADETTEAESDAESVRSSVRSLPVRSR